MRGLDGKNAMNARQTEARAKTQRRKENLRLPLRSEESYQTALVEQDPVDQTTGKPSSNGILAHHVTLLTATASPSTAT